MTIRVSAWFADHSRAERAAHILAKRYGMDNLTVFIDQIRPVYCVLYHSEQHIITRN